MTVTASRLRAVVEADTSKGQKGLQDFGRQVTQTATATRSGLGGISSALRGLGALPVGLGALGITVGAGKLAVDLAMTASAAEESTNKMRVVFGGASGTITSFAQNAARDLGMSRQQAIDAAGTFGNLFTSMGLGQGASANLSQGIVQLAADLGSFNNIGTDLMLEKLRAGLVGEVEPLRAVGINIDAASVKAKALSMGLVDANGAVSQAATLQARYALMLDQSKNAQGDFARTSDGLANSLKIAAGEVQNLKAELGKLTIKPYTVVVHVATEAVKDVNEFVANPALAMAPGRLSYLYKREAEQMFQAYRGLETNLPTQYVEMFQQNAAAAREEINRLEHMLQAGKTTVAEWGDAGVSAALRSAAAAAQWGDAGVTAGLRIAAAAEAAKTAVAKVFPDTSADRWAGLGAQYGVRDQSRVDDAAGRNADVLRLVGLGDVYKQTQTAASTVIANDYAAKMKAANAAIAADLKGEMSAGMNTAIGLLDLRGPQANDPNGPFRDIFRVLDVAKLGMASPWQQGLGIGQEEAAAIGKKFQTGIWDDTVTKFIDVNALKQAVKDKQLGQQFMDAFAASIAAGGTGTDGKQKAGIGATVIPTWLSSIDAQLVADGKKFEAKGAAAYDKIEGGFLTQARASTAFVSMINAMVDNSLARYTGEP